MTHATHTTHMLRRVAALAGAAAALATGITAAATLPAYGFDCDDNQAQVKFADTDFACQSVGPHVYIANGETTAVGEVCAGDDVLAPVTVAVVGGKSTGAHAVKGGTCQVLYEDEQISVAVTVLP